MEKEKLDQLTEKIGGREKLVLIVQRRLKELGRGDVPRVENAPSDLVEVALREAFEEKIDLNVVVPQAPVVRTYDVGNGPSPMLRAPRPGFRPQGQRPPAAPVQGNRMPARPMRRPANPPPRRNGNTGDGNSRGGNRWQGPR